MLPPVTSALRNKARTIVLFPSYSDRRAPSVCRVHDEAHAINGIRIAPWYLTTSPWLIMTAAAAGRGKRYTEQCSDGASGSSDGGESER
jgi:hypothetical protein